MIGCHLWNKSSCGISFLVNIPQPSVSDIIKKWKWVRTRVNEPQSDRSWKIREQGQWKMRHIVWKIHIFDHFMLPALLEQFRDGPVLFQHAWIHVHKDMDEQVWCGKTWLACANLTEHLWKELEWRLWDRPSRQSVSDLKCGFGRMIKNSQKR